MWKSRLKPTVIESPVTLGCAGREYLHLGANLIAAGSSPGKGNQASTVTSAHCVDRLLAPCFDVCPPRCQPSGLCVSTHGLVRCVAPGERSCAAHGTIAERLRISRVAQQSIETFAREMESGAGAYAPLSPATAICELFGARTGTAPWAIASSTGRPNPSYSDPQRNALLRASAAYRFVVGIGYHVDERRVDTCRAPSCERFRRQHFG